MGLTNVSNSIPYSLIGLAVVAVTSIKWLRVAQREHYVPGYVVRFASRWYFSRESTANTSIAVAMAFAFIAAISRPHSPGVVLPALAVGAVCAIFSPVGLGYKGRSSKLAWTRRAKVLYASTLAINAVLLVLAYLVNLSADLATVFIIFSPGLVDLATYLTRPFERRALEPFVKSATAKLQQVNPVRVGITGSYGKTSTKNYIAQLVSGALTVLASPASFNNRGGLARAVNENLLPGTQVFIAEMGTYQKGEIASLVEWVKPSIVAITAIGPVHLERFGSEEAILEAKREIMTGASTVVLNVDDKRLAALADELDREGRHVIRVSGTDTAREVSVVADDDGNAVVYHQRRRLGSTSTPVARTNLAVAVAVALELGVPEDVIGQGLAGLRAVSSRLNVVTTEAGVTVIDDTYNSNPSGARLALAQLEAHSSQGGKRVVVTPGMVELGSQQYDENRALGVAIGVSATHLCVVGLTNRRALLAGAKEGGGRSITLLEFRTREQAVAWVRQNLVSGDAVLYENDLPDHFA
ncbi:MAG: UDP-N-acetylmuramoyl-tripeptide--D-alanyl-D-alanine ligase [Actinomycetota bacterium]|nr:UDP-N-acetylmuramoyl-tripeptide--D-alanyl-D-alanine ligase [Actinomycetota bacterium]